MYPIKYMPNDEHALFKSFFQSLMKNGNNQLIKTIMYYIDKLSEFGFDINNNFKSESLKKLEDNLWELRPNSARILVTFSAKEQAFYILNCFIKKTNTTPEEEKIRARNLINKIKWLI